MFENLFLSDCCFGRITPVFRSIRDRGDSFLSDRFSEIQNLYQRREELVNIGESTVMHAWAALQSNTVDFGAGVVVKTEKVMEGFNDAVDKVRRFKKGAVFLVKLLSDEDFQNNLETALEISNYTREKIKRVETLSETVKQRACNARQTVSDARETVIQQTAQLESQTLNLVETGLQKVRNAGEPVSNFFRGVRRFSPSLYLGNEAGKMIARV